MPHLSLSLSLAAMFLEHWKRRQISLNYSWDLTGMEEEEVRSHTYTVTLRYSLVFACLDYSAVAKSWFQWHSVCLTLTDWKWLMLTVIWCDAMVASPSDSIKMYPPTLCVNVLMWSRPKIGLTNMLTCCFSKRNLSRQEKAKVWVLCLKLCSLRCWVWLCVLSLCCPGFLTCLNGLKLLYLQRSTGSGTERKAIASLSSCL